MNNRLDFNRLPEWMTAKQAAAVLGVHVNTLRIWARNGKISAVKLGPKLWRFNKADLIASKGGIS